MDEWQIEAIEEGAKAAGEINEKQAYALIAALRAALREQDEARQAVRDILESLAACRRHWKRRYVVQYPRLAGPQAGAGAAGVGVEEGDVAGLLPDDDAEAGPGAEGEA